MHWKAGLTPNILIGQLVGFYDGWKVEKLRWNNSHLHNYRGTISFFTNNTKTYLGLILVVKRPQPCFIRRKCRPHPWISQILKIFCSAWWWVGVSAVKKISFVASGLLKVSSCASITLLRRGSLVASKTFKSSNVRFNTQGFSRRVCVPLSRHTADSAVTLGRVLVLSYAG